MTDAQTQVDRLRAHDWRQGSVVPPSVIEAARTNTALWPAHIRVAPEDWVIVVSHSCDVLNRRAENEPFVEVLVARLHSTKKADSRETFGKNSRRFHFEGEQRGTPVRLVAHAYDRFLVDRLLLADATPDQDRVVGHPRDKNDRTLEILIAWIAKRYIRQAFPDAFDCAARPAKEKVDRFLVNHQVEILGVFISFVDRPNCVPRFHLEFRIVIKSAAVQQDWARQKAAIEADFEACWTETPDVEIEDAAVQAKDFTLQEMSGFKKFDRDWISYAYDPESGPAPEGLS